MVDALRDGTIDIIVSSHDPQDVDTKRLPFADAAAGAIGLETLLAAALRLHPQWRRAADASGRGAVDAPARKSSA
jgi:dihydroorotase-like cyclic amidohydrolase